MYHTLTQRKQIFHHSRDVQDKNNNNSVLHHAPRAGSPTSYLIIHAITIKCICCNHKDKIHSICMRWNAYQFWHVSIKGWVSRKHFQDDEWTTSFLIAVSSLRIRSVRLKVIVVMRYCLAAWKSAWARWDSAAKKSIFVLWEGCPHPVNRPQVQCLLWSL